MSIPSSRMRPAAKRLSYKDQRDLESLPARIETLETEIAGLHATVSAPEFYRQPAADIAATQRKLKDLEAELAAAFTRWETLDQSAQGAG